MSRKDLQKHQKKYDEKYWQHGQGELENIRHITLHIGKLIGKLSVYCEQQEHGVNYPVDQIRDEVIPDLLMHSLRLANITDVDAINKYFSRLEENIRRITEKQL